MAWPSSISTREADNPYEFLLYVKTIVVMMFWYEEEDHAKSAYCFGWRWHHLVHYLQNRDAQQTGRNSVSARCDYSSKACAGRRGQSSGERRILCCIGIFSVQTCGGAF